MRLNDTTIVDTFAEAFAMWGTRVVITAETAEWARAAAQSMTGFATSIIGCKCEAGIEAALAEGDTPDGRPGVSVLLFSTSAEGVGKRLVERVGQCVMTCPSTACYSGLAGTETVVVGGQLRYFGDRHQISKLLNGRRLWRVPVMDGEFVVDERFGIQRGLMTTVHAYTNDQQILDLPHKDLRRARAAALSMIPTTTGAARAVGEVLPELKGKLDGMAIRVPTANVSVVDLVAELKRPATEQQINDALRSAAAGPLKGILACVDEELVSIDFNGSPVSSTVDLGLTKVMDGNFVKVLSWYDNEWGFSNRMVDVATMIGRSI